MNQSKDTIRFKLDKSKLPTEMSIKNLFSLYTFKNIKPTIVVNGNFIDITLKGFFILINNGLYDLAIKKYNENDKDNSLSILEKLIAQCPIYSDAYSLIAQIYNEKGNKEKAFDNTISALKWNHYNSKALLLMGTLLQNEGKEEAAESYYRELLVFDSKNITALNNLGQLLMKQNRFDEAEHCFKEIAEIDSNNFLAYYGLTYCSMQKEEYLKAFNNALFGLKYCKYQPKDFNYVKYLSDTILDAANYCREKQTVDDIMRAQVGIEYTSKCAIYLHETHDMNTGYLSPLDENNDGIFHISYNPNDAHFVYNTVMCMIGAGEHWWNKKNSRPYTISANEEHFRYFVDDYYSELSNDIRSKTPEKLNLYFKDLHNSLITQYIQAINELIVLKCYYMTERDIIPQMYLFNLMKIEDEMTANDIELKKDIPKSILKLKSAMVNLRFLFMKYHFNYVTINSHETLEYGMEEAESAFNVFQELTSEAIFLGKKPCLKKCAEALGINRYFNIEDD